MRYVEPVFRPPSEAESLIVQVTLGCSHNACTFCAMYRNKRYSVRPLDEVREEILEAARQTPAVTRVFLGDGDAMAAPAPYLAEVLRCLRAALPALRRVSLYATPMNLLEKSSGELEELRRLGLALAYVGLESGSDEVLKRVGKGVNSRQAVEGVLRAHGAGIHTSVMVLLGLGGTEGWEEHAASTALVLNAMQPRYLSALTWMPVAEAPLYRSARQGRFTLPDDEGVLRELGRLLEVLQLDDTVFHSNHASNPLPLSGRLSRDKVRLLDAVSAAQGGWIPLRPLHLRGT